MEPIDYHIQQERRDEITGAVRRLPETERLVFRMIHVEGFGEKETASCIAMRPAKVRQALSRAKEMLRARLA